MTSSDPCAAEMAALTAAIAARNSWEAARDHLAASLELAEAGVVSSTAAVQVAVEILTECVAANQEPPDPPIEV